MNRRSRFGILGLALAVAVLERGIASRAFAQDTQAPHAQEPVGRGGIGEDPSGSGSSSDGGAPAETADTSELGGLEAMLGESVVTTASRSAERTSTAPSTVYAISAEELRRFGIRTIDEALSFLGLGVYAASARDFVQGIDVGAQGVLLRDRGRHMLGLIDGHVMNSQVTGGVSINEAFGVPLEAINHIEVMLGAGSVMYGSNAMLLVVNVVTRRARDQQGLSAIAELGVAAPHEGKSVVAGERVGRRFRTGVRGATKFGEHADLMISAEWLEDRSSSYSIGPAPAEDVYPVIIRPGETEWGGRAHHRMRAPSGLLSARYRSLRLIVQANHYERGMPLVAQFQDPRSREEQDAIRIDLRHSADLGTHATLASRLYADYHRFSENTSWNGFACFPGQDSGCRFEMAANARWIGLEEQLVFDWFLDGVATTTLGFDLRARRSESMPATYRDLVTGERSTTVPTPHTERTDMLGAAFAQQVWKPSSWLTLNVGARLDEDDNYGGYLSPRVAVTLEPADGTSVRASYSEAFRGPSRYELDELDPVYRLAPGSLKPEVVRAFELEWQQRLSFATFSLRGFRSIYRDFIDTRPATAEEFAAAAPVLSPTADPSIAVVNDNLSTIRSIGVAPSIVLRLAHGLQAAGSFNYSHTRRDGEPLAVMPSVFGNSRMSWQVIPDGVTIAVAAIFSGKRKVISEAIPTDGTVDPQIDVRTTLSGPTGISNLQFRASLTYVHNSVLPYSVTPSDPLLLFPVSSRLYGFVGLQYDFGSSAASREPLSE
jgi:outer membrane receptor protein involved in Fe transport